tara:strand:+ start:133 stop:447 length:315 start_codon:yes stop_codon:yes gene_type:complete
MPYTQEELKKLKFYTDLIDADEQQYLQKKAVLTREANLSGSANVGTKLIRDQSNTVLLFEDPYKNQLLEDDTSKIIHNLKVKKLKTKESDTVLDEIIDRRFREL